MGMSSAWEPVEQEPPSPSTCSLSPTLKIDRLGSSSSTITSTDWTGCAPLWSKSKVRLKSNIF